MIASPGNHCADGFFGFTRAIRRRLMCRSTQTESHALLRSYPWGRHPPPRLSKSVEAPEAHWKSWPPTMAIARRRCASFGLCDARSAAEPDRRQRHGSRRGSYSHGVPCPMPPATLSAGDQSHQVLRPSSVILLPTGLLTATLPRAAAVFTKSRWFNNWCTNASAPVSDVTPYNGPPLPLPGSFLPAVSSMTGWMCC